MREKSESEIQRKWFSVGVAISLSAATFASSIGHEMEKPWRVDGKPMRTALSLGAPGMSSGAAFRVASHVSRQPWSGSWWATVSGSIAIRWRSALVVRNGGRDWPNYQDSGTLTYETHSADRLANMSAAQIRELSPAEKLDIVAGNTDPNSSSYYRNLAEVRDFVREIARDYPSQLGYHGLCHGFSHASIWLPEPDEVVIPATLRLSDGSTRTIGVDFGSSDMKALASYYYGKNSGRYGPNQEMTGKTQEFPRAGRDPFTAGVLHLLLTNLVADADQSFVMDIETGDAVWNYPVVGFRFVTDRSAAGVSSGADPRAVKELYVSTEVDFQTETNPYQTAIGEFPRKGGFKLMTKAYSYRLELTADDEIVGGSWTAASDRPDFAWTLKSKIPFGGDFAFLEKYWRAANVPNDS